MTPRFLAALGFLSLTAASLGAQPLQNQVRDQIRNRLEAAQASSRMAAGGERIHASAVLPRFYEARAYAPAWSNGSGPLRTADALVGAIRGADREGLRPSDYHLAAIEERLESVRRQLRQGMAPDTDRLAQLDLLLSDAFLVYAAHLLAGRVDPETVHSLWLANRREAALEEILGRAVASGRISQALTELLPPQSGYAQLKRALARYRDLAADGGWPTLAEGPRIEKGDTDGRVPVLRTRLRVTGDLSGPDSEGGEAFDEPLDEALRRFQRRHGLSPDGVLGTATTAALNVPVDQRLHQIELNLERWRWLPQDLGRRHILVNIANFELDVVEGDETVLSMRAIVGRNYRRTPVFSDRMTYLVFSPVWHVPRLIAVQDLLPNIKKDPAYLPSMGLKVLGTPGNVTTAIDPAAIEWSEMTPANFPYALRQEPGPKNFLGGVKFMFPNKFNVYLHGTPQQELFAKEARDFSSGCIRLERPLELAEFVLRGAGGDSPWTRDAMKAAIERRTEQMVRLPEPIPVHLLYWTAWADVDGRVHFRRDLYQRDGPLDAALHTRPPGPDQLPARSPAGSESRGGEAASNAGS